MVRKSTQTKREAEALRDYVLCQAVQQQLLQMSGLDIDAPTITAMRLEILRCAPLCGEFQDRYDWRSFVEAALHITDEGEPIRETLRFLNSRNRLERYFGHASHQEKRRLVWEFNMNNKPPKISDIIGSADSFESAAEKVRLMFGAELVVRERFYPKTEKKKYPGAKYHDFKKYRPLLEVDGPAPRKQKKPRAPIVCNEATGFYVLKPDTAAIFVSPVGSDDYNLELIVLRNVPSPDAPFTGATLDWLAAVIQQACYSRRNVRPNHPGAMTQIGLNLGPRHARILGWAKSFTRKLTVEEMKEEDENLIGAMSLFWCLLKAHMPGDVIDPVQELLDSDYPTMATRNIPEGCGFTVEVNDVEYKFSTTGRAPPEGIATGGYEATTHTDPCCVKWGFGWTVSRDTPPGCPLTPGMGGGFVDLGLKVVVQSAVGTMTAFQPKFLHGTTYTGGIMNYGMSINSTQRVYDAIQELIRLRRETYVEYRQDVDVGDGSDSEDGN